MCRAPRYLIEDPDGADGVRRFVRNTPRQCPPHGWQTQLNLPRRSERSPEPKASTRSHVASRAMTTPAPVTAGHDASPNAG